MDRRQGINPRGKGIQIDFYYLGKRCRETLKLEPTKANVTYASRLKSHDSARNSTWYICILQAFSS
jgi:integrase